MAKPYEMILPLFSLTLTSVAVSIQVQPLPDADQPRQVNTDRGAPGERDGEEARRARRRERWEQWRNAAPDERRRLRTERMVDMATRTYELSESQRELVRAEIDVMQAERRASMGASAEEYDRLREEMGRFWRERRERSGDRADGGLNWREARNDPRFRALRERMREIDRTAPWSWRDSLGRVESLLPPEQAKKGRERLESRRNRWGRRGRDREGRSQRRMERALREAERTVQDAQTPSDRQRMDSMLADVRSRIADERLTEQSRQRLRERLEALEREAREVTEALAPHPWEKYTQEFMDRHQLSPAQQAAAGTILKDMLNRVRRLERLNAPKVRAAEALEDRAERDKRLRALNKPIEDLFDQLKRRLHGLLNSAQRKRAGI